MEFPMAAKVRRARKAKYVKLFSPFLMKETKHELIGEPMESAEGRRQWARCTLSRHSQLVDLDVLEAKSDKTAAIVQVSKEDSKIYNPSDVYAVGDVIYHQKWDDLGVVLSKEIISNGGFAIIVQFEKNKEKKLIENLVK
jgi:hypothetical protein